MKDLLEGILLVLLGLTILGANCAPKRFDWNNYCSMRKECPEGKWCYIETGPDGEPYEYGQCIKDED